MPKDSWARSKVCHSWSRQVDNKGCMYTVYCTLYIVYRILYMYTVHCTGQFPRVSMRQRVMETVDLNWTFLRSHSKVLDRWSKTCVISVINDRCLVLSCILFITLLTPPRLDLSAVGRILDKVIKVLCDYSIWLRSVIAALCSLSIILISLLYKYCAGAGIEIICDWIIGGAVLSGSLSVYNKQRHT